MTTKDENCTSEFFFKVNMWTEDENGKKTPVYTTDDQFGEDGKPISGSFGYRVFEDAEDGSTTTVQRDAIYNGTKDATVTIGAETTEMIFSMQANQYCYIVNVPAGTKYTVEEIQGDGSSYNHFYSSVSVLEGDDTTGTYEVVTEKEVSEGEKALTDHSVDGYVSANSSSKVIFKNWAGSFFVYHSGDNTIEEISFADDRVKAKYDADSAKVVYTFDIADETKDTFLYGGYYKAYAGAGSDYEGGAGNETPELSKPEWTKDSTGKAYDGVSAKWTLAEAYDVSGFDAVVKGGETYYLKEVPETKYLQPYFHYTYYKATGNLATAWLISDVDDLNYTETGFVIVEDYKPASVTATLTVKNKVGGASVLLKPTSIFRANGVQGGYLTYLEILESGLLSTDKKVLQYWITPDGLTVTGNTSRVYKALDNKANIKSNLESETIDPTITLVD